MQLRQNVDYSHLQGTFPVTTKRFENLGALSLSPQRYDTQPAAIAAGCFRHTADTSSIVTDVWRKQTRGPSGPTAVSHSFARTPREGTEIAPAPGRRNLALTRIPLSPSSRTATPPCGHLERLFLCATGRYEIGLWRTAITSSAHRTGISVRLFGGRVENLPKPALSICRTKRKKPYLPKRNQS